MAKPEPNGQDSARTGSSTEAANAPSLERYMTYRLHMLNKLSDRASHELYLARTGLGLGEARCLAAVGSFPALSVVELAFEANLDKAQASRAAQVLVDKGYLSKQPSPQDARRVELSLTESGRSTWRDVMALIDQRNREIFGVLSRDEQQLLGRMFDRLLLHARRRTPA